jgi:HlyD family secretion protein
MKRNSNSLIFILIILAIGGSIAVYFGNKLGWFKKKKGQEVEFAEVKQGTIIEKVSASGKIQPETEVKISADVSGEIILLNVKEGDSVKVNQLLVRIRPDNYQSAVDRAKAGVNSAKSALEQAKAAEIAAKSRFERAKIEYDRNEPLYKQKVISDLDYQQIKMNLSVAQSDWEAAQANTEAARFNISNAEAALKDALENLRKTTILSPVSGIVSKLNVELGERVVGTMQMTGTEIMRIANLSVMEVVVDVNENDIVRVHLGDTAEIDVDAYSNTKRKFKGTVTAIANSAKDAANAESVTEFQVKVRINPESYKDLTHGNRGKSPFRPGMTASLDIFTDKKENILMVPLAAVTLRGSESDEKDKDKKKDDTEGNTRKVDDRKEVVLVAVNGKVEIREVITGISDFENIEIISGVKKGEKVITGPYMAVSKTLKAGDEVAERGKDEKDKK